MFSRPGTIALLLSAGAASFTTLILALFADPDGNTLLLALMTSFVVCFLLISFGRRYISRDAQRTRELIRKLTGKDAEVGQNGAVISLSELRREIEVFADLKQKEIDELRKQEAFRKDFIADVSHELKTPIFAAQGFVHTLLDGAVKDKSVRKKFLKKAAKSLDGLDVLVQDLLTLSQIETGQIKMRFEKFDLFALTEEVFDQFRGKSDKKEISLRIDGPVRKVMVYADWRRISQVMTNLISNAIKHSSGEEEVVVSFSVKKNSVVTGVRDFGEGIPAEHLDRIFERFYRVDKSRSREKGGTGLGLAIVKHILEGHNTRANVKSEPGKGSTFSFKLPRARVEKDGNGENQQSAEE